MTNDTSIEKMESTPFSRQIDSIITLTFDGEYACKPHIFTCYNNEVSSSLYLHNKLILLNSSQNCNNESSNEYTETIISQLINDLDNRLAKFLHKELFYEYIDVLSGSQSLYIKYIKSVDLLYTEKTFASSRGFVMYYTGENGADTGGGSGGTSGTFYHNLLENRNIASQHTIAAITDLQAMLDGKVHDSDARLTDARPANGGISNYANRLMTNLDCSIGATFDGVSTWRLEVNHSLYKNVSVGIADTATVAGSSDYLRWRNPDGSIVPSHYLKYVRTSPLSAGGRLYLQAGINEYNAVEVMYSDSSGRSDSLFAPNNGFGNIRIGTERGLLSAAPNYYYPTINTSFSFLYFETNNHYILSIGHDGGTSTSTRIDPGLSTDFLFGATIRTIGTVVMYSTT